MTSDPPAAGTLVTTTVYAACCGCTQRHINRLIGKGLPATKVGRRWMIDPAQADPWIAEHAPHTMNRQPVPTAGPDEGVVQPAAPEPAAPPATELEGLTRHITRLDAVLGGLTQTLYNGRFDPRVVTALKQVSGELRQLELHRLEMRKADEQLMDRTHHTIIVETIARSAVVEIDNTKSIIPDQIMAALTAAGVDVSDPKKAMVAMATAAGGIVTDLRARLADRIDASKDAAT